MDYLVSQRTPTLDLGIPTEQIGSSDGLLSAPASNTRRSIAARQHRRQQWNGKASAALGPEGVFNQLMAGSQEQRIGPPQGS